MLRVLAIVIHSCLSLFLPFYLSLSAPYRPTPCLMGFTVVVAVWKVRLAAAVLY